MEKKGLTPKQFVELLNSLNKGRCRFETVSSAVTPVPNAIKVCGIDDDFAGRIIIKYPQGYQWRDDCYFGQQLESGHKKVYNLLNAEKVIAIPADANGNIGVAGFVKAMNELNAGKSYQFEAKQGHPDTFIIKGVRKGMILSNVTIPNGFTHKCAGGVHVFHQRNLNGYVEDFYLEVG